MKLSKRRITAQKVMAWHVRQAVRHLKKTKPLPNPFRYLEGIKASHRIDVMYMPPTA